MQTILMDFFREPLLRIISFLHRQTLLKARMKSACTKVFTTKRTSLARTVKWFCISRDQVPKCMQDKDTVLALVEVWRVTTVAVK